LFAAYFGLNDYFKLVISVNCNVIMCTTACTFVSC